MERILIVEDEPALSGLLQDYLRMAGFEADVIADGLEVVEAVRADPPALILLDLMLPGRDGMDICKEIRSFSNLPIIMVTARVEEIDRLLGLELGADDYICKPYSPREVVARVKAVLRRSCPVGDAPPPEEGGLQLDESAFQASLGGRPLSLTPVEFRLLKALKANPGRVFSRAQLMSHLYPDRRVVTDRTVDTHVKNLRRKLADAGGGGMIRSVYGVGYRFEPPES